jgi:hypothetical protein
MTQVWRNARTAERIMETMSNVAAESRPVEISSKPFGEGRGGVREWRAAEGLPRGVLRGLRTRR